MDPSSGGDRIELRGLRVVGIHGVLDEERERAQPFEVDLDIDVDLRGAGLSDRLAETVDYGSLAERAAAVVRTESHALLERLAQRIADAVLEEPRVAGVVVTVRKLRPPVAVDLATAGVRVVRP